MTVLAKSALSLIEEYLVGEIEELFPEKHRLFNPYRIERNNEMFLKDGFAVGYGPGENDQIENCKIGERREIQITLSKQFYALENDAEGRMAGEKELMEEFRLLKRKLWLDPTLNGNSQLFEFKSDGGVELVFVESEQYINIKGLFESQHFETV